MNKILTQKDLEKMKEKTLFRVELEELIELLEPNKEELQEGIRLLTALEEVK